MNTQPRYSVKVQKKACGYITIDFGLGKFHLPQIMAQQLLLHLEKLLSEPMIQKEP